MEKIIKYIPLVVFLSYMGKLFLTQPNVLDAPILLILAVMASFYEFKSQTTKIKELEVKLQEIEKVKKELNEIKNFIASAKLGNQIRLSNVK